MPPDLAANQAHAPRVHDVLRTHGVLDAPHPSTEVTTAFNGLEHLRSRLAFFYSQQSSVQLIETVAEINDVHQHSRLMTDSVVVTKFFDTLPIRKPPPHISILARGTSERLPAIPMTVRVHREPVCFTLARHFTFPARLQTPRRSGAQPQQVISPLSTEPSVSGRNCCECLCMLDSYPLASDVSTRSQQTSSPLAQRWMGSTSVPGSTPSLSMVLISHTDQSLANHSLLPRAPCRGPYRCQLGEEQ